MSDANSHRNKLDHARSSQAARVLVRAMRDRKHLLRKLIIGDMLGLRRADRRKPAKRDG